NSNQPNKPSTKPRADAKRQEPIKISSLSEMLEPDLNKSALVKGVLDRGTLALVYGEPSCGKTFLTLDMVLHIAMGRAWFGHRVRKGRVVYVAAEAGKSIQNRVAAFASKHG